MLALFFIAAAFGIVGCLSVSDRFYAAAVLAFIAAFIAMMAIGQTPENQTAASPRHNPEGNTLNAQSHH